MIRYTCTRLIVLFLIVSIVIARPVAAPAQSQPLKQIVSPSRGVNAGRTNGLSSAAHNVFGTIVSFTNMQTNFVLRTRASRFIVVDVTNAARSGQFAAPLFAGKLVAVNGRYDRRHVLYATAVSSMAHLDIGTPPDT